MRWDPTDEILRGLEDEWSPRIISAALVEGAQGNRVLWDDVARKIAGFDVQAQLGAKAWAYTQRIAFATQAVGSLGLPAGLTTEIADAFGKLVLSPPKDPAALAAQLTKTAIGIATTAIAAVPIIGPIAAAIGSLATFLVGLSEQSPETVQEVFPPQRIYQADEEKLAMNAIVLPALSQSNWTDLFLPALGSLKVSQRQDVLGAWLLESDASSGFGFVPGSQCVSHQIQVGFNKKSDRIGGSSASARDVGDFFPGCAQLITAVSSQVQTPTAALYSVRANRILAAWREYLEAVTAFGRDLYDGRGIKGTGLEALTEDQRHQIVSAMMSPFFVSRIGGKILRGVMVNWTPTSQVESIVDAFVQPWCETVEQRQDYYLNTIVCAYVDPSSPGLATMRRQNRLGRNRALLLKSPARYKVDLDDVIDDDYRRALFMATAGSTLVAPSGPGGASVVGLDDSEPPPAPPPSNPSGGPPFQGAPSSGADWVLPVLGILGVGGLIKARASRRRIAR